MISRRKHKNPFVRYMFLDDNYYRVKLQHECEKEEIDPGATLSGTQANTRNTR